MHGFRVVLAKEFREIVRTWRMWVLPLIMLSFGLLSPIVALVTPQLLDSLAGSQAGVRIEIPDPTTIDAYLQFSKNNLQIALFAIIISMAGMISGERKSGTAALVLTKPVSRASFVSAKWVANSVLVTVSTVLGWGVCMAGTAILFDTDQMSGFAQATLLWLALALTYVAVMALLSVVIKSQAGAAGAGLGVYLVLAIFSAWGPARDNALVGLYTAGDRLLMGEEPVVLMPLLSAAVVIVVCILVAIAAFRRQEL